MSGHLDWSAVNWRALFDEMHPGFFEKPNIRALPEEKLWDEMALDLRGFDPGALETPVSEGVTFGSYEGDLDALRDVVRRVDATWPELFDGSQRVYCAFDGGSIASFCMIEDMGEHGGLRVGGPGCVGTPTEYRRRGIGLRLVQNATAILKDEGFDLSYIHFTGVGPWYAKLGYEVVLRWSREGIE